MAIRSVSRSAGVCVVLVMAATLVSCMGLRTERTAGNPSTTSAERESASFGSTAPSSGKGFAICSGPEWRTIHPSSDSITYSCRELCPVQDGSACRYATSDSLGNPLQALALVTDQMGGVIRFNALPADQVRGVVFLHAGSSGTGFIDDPQPSVSSSVRKLWSDFEKMGVLVVSMKWERGVANNALSILTGGAGWFSRKDPSPTDLRRLSVRPASVMKFVGEHLVPEGVKFGSFGCSAGVIATFSAAYWNGLNQILDYQFFSGGPPVFYDVNAGCALKTADTVGVCEHRDPMSNGRLLSCKADSDCGSQGRCSYPQVDEPGTQLVDYIHVTGGDCANHVPNPAFESSSFKYNVGDWNLPYVVDANFAVGGFPDGKTDTTKGIVFSGGSVYNGIAGGTKNYYQTENATHCAAAYDENELPKSLARVRAGLGI